MVRKLFTIVLLALAVILVSAPACASLVPMSWGYPTLVQDHSLTAFEKNFAQSVNTEAAAVAFPTSSTSSIFGTSFPTITQTAASNDLLESCKFMQEREFSAFAYPYLSIGTAGIPAMGFL